MHTQETGELQVELLRVENGKIAEAKISYDHLEQMSQLGLIPQGRQVLREGHF